MIDEDELLNVTRIRSPPPGARTNNDWDRFHGRSGLLKLMLALFFFLILRININFDK